MSEPYFHYGIIGLGRSGMGALKFLIKEKYSIIVWDDSKKIRQKISDSFRGFINIQPVEEWKNVQEVILSPGIPPYHKYVKKVQNMSISCITEVDLFLSRVLKTKVIGITGTNGKSSLVALIEHMLKISGIEVISGGNLGIPCIELPLLSKDGVYILELSSYQLYWLRSYPFFVSCITNITFDHLEWHETWVNYLNAKLKITKGSKYIVLGKEDNLCRPWHHIIKESNKQIVNSMRIEDLAYACLKHFNLNQIIQKVALRTFKSCSNSKTRETSFCNRSIYYTI